MTDVQAQKKRILVVEDYAPNVLVATTYLEVLGYGYDVAATGEEALDKFLPGRFAAVLMDVQLPVMDGLETTRRMRAIEKEENLQPVPIIAMTGRASQDDQLFCARAGMNACLSKPFRKEDLERTLREYVPQ